MNHAARAGAMQVAESHWTVWEQAPGSQDVGSGATQKGESVVDTSDWCSDWSRTPQNSWNEKEKSNQKHDTCGAGEQVERNQQEGWAEEQRGVGEDTCDCDGECHRNLWSRAGAQEKCSHDENKNRGWEREVEAEKQGGRVQGDNQHCTTGGEPQSGGEAAARARR